MNTSLHAPKPRRDSVTTIREDGSRLFLHPADVRGRFTRWRRWSGWFLIAVYLSLPWIQIGEHPAVFLDVAARRFHLFGFTLAFQDTWLLFFLITGLGFALFFVTALLGRVWCGWACPQTVFLEHVYRRIERWIEGDASKRRALDAAPWTAAKVIRRAGKQVLFILVSAVIAHLFLAYFVSIPELWAMMHAAPAAHWHAFVFVFIFTAVLYFNFAWFREQLCIVICPYGRMQSVLIDDHSLVIGYDERRGEPRGRRLRRAGAPDVGVPSGALAKEGDCIDCNRCVQVCPTGIDIRQGLQVECIGCAACIDACDAVMAKVGSPAGLIRYDSLKGLAGGATRWLRPRTLVYAVLLAAGAAVAAWGLSTVRPASLGITRMTGAPYILDDGSVRNQFLVRLVNKRDVPVSLVLSLPDAPPGLGMSGFSQAVEVGPLEEMVSPLVLRMSRADYRGPFELRVLVAEAAGGFTLEHTMEFVGPDALPPASHETPR